MLPILTHSVSWICCNCGLPNFSSSLFVSFLSPAKKNPFDSLQNLQDHNLLSGSPLKSPFKPPVASTPQKKNLPTSCKTASNHCPPKAKTKNFLSSLVINFGRYLTHKRSFLSTLSTLPDLDIIFGTETWLTSDIRNSELNLNDYDIYRRDRISRSGGGIFICVKKVYKSLLVHKSKDSETIFVKINIPKKKSYYFMLCLQSA